MGVNKEALTRFAVLASIVDWCGVTFEDTEAWTIKHLDDFCVVWDYMNQTCTLSYDVDGHRWSVHREVMGLTYDGITEDDFLMVIADPWEPVSTIEAGGKDESPIIEGFTYGLTLLLNIGGERPSIRLYGDKETFAVVFVGYAVTKIFVMNSRLDAEKIIKKHIGPVLEAAFDKIEN